MRRSGSGVSRQDNRNTRALGSDRRSKKSLLELSARDCSCSNPSRLQSILESRCLSFSVSDQQIYSNFQKIAVLFSFHNSDRRCFGLAFVWYTQSNLNR